MKLAAVQMDVQILGKNRNLRRVLEKMVEARRAGASLVIFPECALTGYCFTSREEAWPLAETIPGPSTDKIAIAARDLDCSVVVGMLEREGEERGYRFAGHSQIIDPEGHVLASAGESEEVVLVAEVDPAVSDLNRVVRSPGEYEYDRIAARRPEMYDVITARQTPNCT